MAESTEKPMQGANACPLGASTKELINFIYADLFPTLDGAFYNLCDIVTNNAVEADPDGARFACTDEYTKELTRPVCEALENVKHAAREVLNTFMLGDYDSKQVKPRI